MTNINNMTPSDFDLEYSEATGLNKVEAPLVEDELPEKYKGKTAAEIATMHMNAEQRLSKMGNELGSLRSLTDQVLNLKKDNVKVPEPQRPPVTVEALYADPDKAIRETIENSGVARKVEDAVTRAESIERQLAHRDFESRHPSYKSDLNDDSFQEWVTGNSARVELFRRADSFDVHSADALWQMWEEHKELSGIKEKREVANTKRREALAAGKTVSDSSTDPSPKGPTYSRVKLMELQMKAHGGDLAARNRWNDPTFQSELLKAYSEERVK